MRHAAACVVLLLTSFLASAVAAAAPDPSTVVTLADVQKVLGGTFKAQSPEPGVLFYEEEGGQYREVHVYLWPADGQTVQSLRQNALDHGEPVDDVPGIGEAAMYRPQSYEATVQKDNAAGETMWLSVSVLNAASADTKKLAVELIRRGAARL